MAGKGLMLVFAIFLTAIMLAYQAKAVQDSFYTISSSDFTCSIHGDIKLEARTLGLKPEDIKIKAKHVSETDYFDVNGAWFDSRDIELGYLYNGEMVFFRSAGTLFTKKGDYYISLTYPDVSKEFRISCPEFMFSCNAINIDIEECYSDNKDFVVVFLGEGLENQKTGLDLLKDIEYRIESDRQMWGFDSLPKNLTIKQIESNRYEMRFQPDSSYKNNSLKYVEIRVKQNLETISLIGSGCSGGLFGNIYPNARDLKIDCPTGIKQDETEETDEEARGEIGESMTDEKETGAAKEKGLDIAFILAIMISGAIGLVIGCLITFIILNKKK